MEAMNEIAFFSKKKKMKNMAFYGYVDRKCYIMIFSWIIPKDGFICFVSSQLLMIVEKKLPLLNVKKKFCVFVTISWMSSFVVHFLP